jgi:chromosome segregation ATPase
MQVLAKQERTVDERSLKSLKDTDHEEMRSALNRMMEASALWKRERSQLVAACDQLRRQLRDSESALAAARERSQGDQPIGDTGATAWEHERAQLIAQHDQLRGQLSDSEEGAAIALERQVAAAVDRVRAELTAENERLRAELQRSADEGAQWAEERSQLLDELEGTKQLVADTEMGAALALDRQIATAVQHVKAEWSAAEEKLCEEIRELQAEGSGDGAPSQQQVQDAVDKIRKEWAVERDRLSQELDTAMHLCARRGSENAELAAERDRLSRALAEAEEIQQMALTESEKAANALQSMTDAAVARVRAELEAEKEQLRNQDQEDLDELQTELDDARALLAEAQGAYAGSISQLKEAEGKSAELQGERNRLREQLEELSDIAAQKELECLHLKEEYDRTTQILEEATSPTSSRGVTTELVFAEEVRVEELIRDLSLLIDDPATELSAVIRKTVERAQLDFYLKGLRFSSTGESPSAH